MNNAEITVNNSSLIDKLIFSIMDSPEYNNVQFLIFTIRKPYLIFLSTLKSSGFKVPQFLIPLTCFIDRVIKEQGIELEEILKYMISLELQNDFSKGWVHYYYTCFISPQCDGSTSIQCSRETFIHIFTGFVLDFFNSTRSLDINLIVDQEKQVYQTNQYGLSIVDNVEFKTDYFIFDGKAYLYNLLTNTKQLRFEDGMPGFARIITDQVNDGDILLRLDERLALPKDQAISYSSANFEKYRGPQFHFQKSVFTDIKTIIVHISPETSNKLLMVIKKDYDYKNNKAFLHIEIETLPFVKDSHSSPVITTFLHGMYYLEDDCFIHIDYTKNQYSVEDYLIKYSDSVPDKPIDLYTERKELHYKIWCIENGTYSREVWYQLMIASLPEEYQTLLNEILA